MRYKYRNNDYKFFDRHSGIIGVTAYRSLRYYVYIENFLNMKENYDDYYGRDNLVELVDADMRARFDSALRNLRFSLKENPTREDIKHVAGRCEICKRGLAAMKKYVEDNKLFIPPEVWIAKTDDHKFGIVQREHHKSTAATQHKDIKCFFSLLEVAIILNDHKKTLDIKKSLTNHNLKSEVVEVVQSKYTEEEFDEPIPF